MKNNSDTKGTKATITYSRKGSSSSSSNNSSSLSWMNIASCMKSQVSNSFRSNSNISNQYSADSDKFSEKMANPDEYTFKTDDATRPALVPIDENVVRARSHDSLPVRKRVADVSQSNNPADKRNRSWMDIIADAHLDDIEFLLKSINEFSQRNRTAAFCQIMPPNWDPNESQRFRKFIEDIGFNEMMTSNPFYKSGKIVEIGRVRDLLTEEITKRQRLELTRERSLSSLSYNSLSSNSATHESDLGLARMRTQSDAVFPTTSLIIDTDVNESGLPIRSYTASDCRYYTQRTESDESPMDRHFTPLSSVSPIPSIGIRINQKNNAEKQELLRSAAESPTTQLTEFMGSLQVTNVKVPIAKNLNIRNLSAQIIEVDPKTVLSRVEDNGPKAISSDTFGAFSDPNLNPRVVGLSAALSEDDFDTPADDRDEVRTLPDTFEDDEIISSDATATHIDLSTIPIDDNQFAISSTDDATAGIFTETPIATANATVAMNISPNRRVQVVPPQYLSPISDSKPFSNSSFTSNFVSSRDEGNPSSFLQVSEGSNFKIRNDDKSLFSGTTNLKKTATVPACHSAPMVQPNSLTPGNLSNTGKFISYSQDDTKDLCTPQQTYPAVKVAGKKNFDWGVSKATRADVCSKLFKKHIGSCDTIRSTGIMKLQFQPAAVPDQSNLQTQPPPIRRIKTTGGLLDDNLRRPLPEMKGSKIFSSACIANEGHSLITHDLFTSANHHITTTSRNSSGSVGSFSLLDSNFYQSPTEIYRDSFTSARNDNDRRQAAHDLSPSRLDENRSRQKMNKSQQKWRRMSVRFRKSLTDSSIELRQSRTSSSSMSFISPLIEPVSISSENDSSMKSRDSFQPLTLQSTFSPVVATKYKTSTNYHLRHLSSSDEKSVREYDHDNHDDDNNDDDDDDGKSVDSGAMEVDIDQAHDAELHNDIGMDLGIEILESNDHSFMSTSMTRSLRYSIDDHRDYIPALNELTFKVSIIGGTYQHCFQDTQPVIAPPNSFEKRITNVSYFPKDGTLTLTLFLPKDREEKIVHFSSSWTWIRASPVGYVLFKDHLRAGVHNVGYYIPKHPSDWDRNLSSTSSFTLDRSVNKSAHHLDRLVAHGASGNDSFASNHDISMSSVSAANILSSRNNLRFHEEPYNDDQDHSGLMEDDIYRNPNQSTDSIVFVSSSHQISSDHEFRIDESNLSLEEEVVSASSNVNWNNIEVISLVLSFLLDLKSSSDHQRLGAIARSNQCREESNSDDLKIYLLVNKSWAVATYWHLSSYYSHPNHIQLLENNDWNRFQCLYDSGRFLSEGACKRVYRVLDNMNRFPYAVSIMDVLDMKERGMEEAIRQELEISMLCSSLYRLHICPNLLQIHSVFQSKSLPQPDLWSNHSNSILSSKVSKGKGNKQKLYQYVRMEFCQGGDLDSLIAKRRSCLLELEKIRMILFQMIFSIYSCREQFMMRHYDIKLLNFLITTAKSLVWHEHEQSWDISSSTVLMEIGFGSTIFSIPLSCNDNELVKLSDFGTSVIGASGLGEPITVQQFTTLENTPIEYLLLGSDARQAYSGDTFCLGLSMFHLIVGNNSYEELLQDVYCPDYLVKKLKKYWTTKDIESCYYVISEVIESLDTSEEDEGNLQSSPKYQSHPYKNNPIWKILMDTLNMSIHSQNRRRNNNRKALECYSQFQQDHELWSIHHGNHPIIKKFQENMKLLGESCSRLLDKLIHFDPSRRCTLHEALLSPLFRCLHRDTTASETCLSSTSASLSQNTPTAVKNQSKKKTPFVVSYMHYYRPETASTSTGGNMRVDMLPII